MQHEYSVYNQVNLPILLYMKSIHIRHTKVFRCFLVGIFLTYTNLSFTEAAWVLNPAGKAGRGLVEVVGDPNSGRWTTPAIDHVKHKAINVAKHYNIENHVVETKVEYTGDNCNEDESLCLALYYFKSARGAMDLGEYSELIFEIDIIESPSDALLLRVGSFPTRAEMSINDKLPTPSEGYKRITITKEEFSNFFFEDFSFQQVADPFSLTTNGTIKYKIKNIQWK